jgi:hypothetical protein
MVKTKMFIFPSAHTSPKEDLFWKSPATKEKKSKMGKKILG